MSFRTHIYKRVTGTGVKLRNNEISGGFLQANPRNR